MKRYSVKQIISCMATAGRDYAFGERSGGYIATKTDNNMQILDFDKKRVISHVKLDEKQQTEVRALMEKASAFASAQEDFRSKLPHGYAMQFFGNYDLLLIQTPRVVTETE